MTASFSELSSSSSAARCSSRYCAALAENGFPLSSGVSSLKRSSIRGVGMRSRFSEDCSAEDEIGLGWLVESIASKSNMKSFVRVSDSAAGRSVRALGSVDGMGTPVW